MMGKVLNKKFFSRPALIVAPELLGKFLVRRIGNREISSMITEVEVYEGLKDRAAHSFKGLTKRNAPLFGEPGYWYIYFIYGIFWMLNVVTHEPNYPSGILIRGTADASGPGRLTRYFKIDNRFYAKPVSKETGLWIEDRGIKIEQENIKRSKRIGVEYAGKYWANRKYRFFVD